MRKNLVLVLGACALIAGCSKTETAGASPAPSSEAAKPVAEVKIARHPWGSFKVGSFVATKSTTAAAGYKMATEMKTTLTALTADKATIEIETTVAGHTTKTTTDIPLTAAAATPAPTGSASTPQADVKTTEETITVAGRNLNCKVTTATAETGGMKSESKTWMSDEVPGFLVKSVVKSSGAASSETTTEVTDFKAS
jgi:hypothetical protein